MKYYIILLLCFLTTTSSNFKRNALDLSKDKISRLKKANPENSESKSSETRPSESGNYANSYSVRSTHAYSKVDYKKRSEALTILTIILGFVSTLSAILVVRTVGSMKAKP